MSKNDDQTKRPATDEQRAEKRLDAAIASLREQAPDEHESEEALQRIWKRLETAAAAPAASACEELRSRLAPFLAGELDEGSTALLQAHAGECLPCRRTLKEERERLEGRAAAAVSTAAGGGSSRSSWRRWAAAAAVLLSAVGLGSLLRDRPGVLAPAGAKVETATLVELDGAIFSPGEDGAETLVAGAELPMGRWLRTGKGARALLRLADGSRVEMNERSQLLVREDAGGTTLQLSRGDVIVEAAKRRQRDLFVETDEMTVAVKGTIFTVEHGLKGSRVGVLEGSVQVDAGRGESPLLMPGEQLASRAGLADRALREQVRWSRQADHYAALLDELEAVQASLAQRPFEHRLRHASRLLDAMPQGTVFYAAIPNSSTNLRRFAELVTERLDESPELRSWWKEQAERLSAAGQPTFDELLATVERVSDSLGDELVVALVLPVGAEAEPLPLLVAPVRDEAELRHLVEAEIGDRLREQGAPFPGLLDRKGLEDAAGSESGFHLAVAGGAVLAGPSADVLLAMAEGLESGSTAFASTHFHRALADEYRRGAETLIAFDLENLVRRGDGLRFGGLAGPVMNSTGFSGLEHFILRSTGDEPGAAVLSFNEERRGVASWLAEPGPMGSLEFVSPRAMLVVSAVFKDPEAMLEDLQELAAGEDFSRGLAEFRAETGVDPVGDIAAPLGGELTVAIDGPLFPRPAWKAVLEVYDPVRLQHAIELLVRRFDEWNAEQAAAKGLASPEASIELITVQGPAGPRHVLRMEGWPTEVHYAFADGYLVATGAAHRLESALQVRELGASIMTAPEFTKVLPKDGQAHLSLLAWQNLGPAVGLLLQGLGGQLPGAQDLQAGELESACLLHARASERSIAFSVSSAGAGPGAHVAALLRRALVEGLQDFAERGLLDATRRPARYDGAASPAEPAKPTRSY